MFSLNPTDRATKKFLASRCKERGAFLKKVRPAMHAVKRLEARAPAGGI
jgi:hypothetical protein